MQLAMYVTLVNFFLHILWNYLFVQSWGWGIKGTALASNMSFTFFYFSLSFLLQQNQKTEFIQQIKLDNIVNGFWHFFKHTYYSISTQCIRALLIVGTSFIASSISVEAAATVGVLNSLMPFLKMYSVALFRSVLNFVGCEIGQGNAERAKKMSNHLIIECVVLSVMVYFLIIATKGFLSRIFTSNEVIIAMTYDLLVWIMPLRNIVMNITFMWNGYFVVLQKAKVAQNLNLL